MMIQRISRSEDAHVQSLTEHVLKDVSLTGKVLRLINAAYYGVAGAGTITSIPRAVSLLGFRTVGTVASSLMLFECMPQGVDKQVRVLVQDDSEEVFLKNYFTAFDVGRIEKHILSIDHHTPMMESLEVAFLEKRSHGACGIKAQGIAKL